MWLAGRGLSLETQEGGFILGSSAGELEGELVGGPWQTAQHRDLQQEGPVNCL